mmetsp:Transcript_12194/g.18847  ORF Transcript_12194/g.18847 Transcript_12194/m.18847 type:complete len:123 (-) Transcript_12194:149-517(-)
MCTHFKGALQENEMTEDCTKQMMQFIHSYFEDFEIDEGGNDLGTIEQVKSNSLFTKMDKDLLFSLTNKIESDGIEELRPYVDKSTSEYKKMMDKVACLLCNNEQEYFGVTDEDLERSAGEGI